MAGGPVINGKIQASRSMAEAIWYIIGRPGNAGGPMVHRLYPIWIMAYRHGRPVDREVM